MQTTIRLTTAVAMAATTLLLAGSAAAQDLQYGLKGGINVSNVSFSADDVSIAPGARGGFAVGGFVVRDLRDGWSGVAEVLLTMKGSELDIDGGGNAKARLTYVEVPVLGRAALDGPSGARVHLYAGPAVAFKVGENVDPDLDQDDDASGDNVFKPFDFSLAFGGSVRVREVFVDLRYTLGLVNVADEDDFPSQLSAKNRTFTISIGWQIR